MIEGTIIYRSGDRNRRLAGARVRQARHAENYALSVLRRPLGERSRLNTEASSREETRDVARRELSRLTSIREVHETAAIKAGKMTKDLSQIDAKILIQRKILAEAELNLNAARDRLSAHDSTMETAPSADPVDDAAATHHPTDNNSVNTDPADDHGDSSVDDEEIEGDGPLAGQSERRGRGRPRKDAIR